MTAVVAACYTCRFGTRLCIVRFNQQEGAVSVFYAGFLLPPFLSSTEDTGAERKV